MDAKKILIVCYTFPPMPGVGGRRWAKFAKYLHRAGWEVHVVCGTPVGQAHSPWTSDTENLHIQRFRNRYPEILNQVPETLFQKLWYRICLIYLKCFTRGNYYDRGAFWGKYFRKEIPAILNEHQIKTVIVSGGPFSLLYHAAKLKVTNPGSRIIADHRDPWLNGGYFGMGGLSPSRKKEEIRRFRIAQEYADYIISPYSFISGGLEPENMAKFRLFPHAVDTDDLNIHDIKKPWNGEWVYFGSLYAGMESIIRNLAVQMRETQAVKRLTIYSNDRHYGHIFEEERIGEKVEYLAPVNQKRVFEILQSGAVAIIFIMDSFKDFQPTKIVENIAARCTMLAIGSKGQLSDFIVENRLGVFIDIANDNLPDIGALMQQLQYNSDFPIEKFTFEYQVRELEQLLS